MSSTDDGVPGRIAAVASHDSPRSTQQMAADSVNLVSTLHNHGYD